jgi:KaiC/GvpD/RAD55 family RecA-like ATPase
MHVVIDLFGDEDVITITPEESPESLKRKEMMRKHALEEIFRRAPQPQVIPVILDK